MNSNQDSIGNHRWHEMKSPEQRIQYLKDVILLLQEDKAQLEVENTYLSNKIKKLENALLEFKSGDELPIIDDQKKKKQ